MRLFRPTAPAVVALTAALLSGVPLLAPPVYAGPQDAAHAPARIATSCRQGAVQRALDRVADGGVVRVRPGACTWTRWIEFSNAKGATLTCAQRGACDIAVSGTVLGMNDRLSGRNTHLYRISGFRFHGTGSMQIWFYGSGVLERVRIDHNRFRLAPGAIPVFFGAIERVARFHGVIDHNRLTSRGSVTLVHNVGRLDPTPAPPSLGTRRNLFIEDNVVRIKTITNTGMGCVDSWGGAEMVWRHNRTLNCLVASHGTLHAGGPANFEVYGNRMGLDRGADGSGLEDGYRLFHHHGSGSILVFGNRFTALRGHSRVAISVYDYRSDAATTGDLPVCDGTASIDGNRAPTATYRGYPCWHQAARDFQGRLSPMYAWDNTWSDTGRRVKLVTEGGQYLAAHLRPNRDFYNAVSTSPQTSTTAPFDGSRGMGWGLLSRRPSTCTATPEPLDAGRGGVGYFATDTAALFWCSAPDTWSVHYRPFAYPHPLTRS